MTHERPCKIVLAGDGGTGKTTLISSKNMGSFNFKSPITIGVDFAIVKTEYRESEYSFLVYDLGGQQRFQFLHDSYIIGTKAAIILYDLTRDKTFRNIPKWISLLNDENLNMPIILVGSKKDLVQPEDIQYYDNEWTKLQKKIRPSPNISGHYFITSKKCGDIDMIFYNLAKLIVPIYFHKNISSVSVIS